jgi:large subunit ribosomal protein L10
MRERFSKSQLVITTDYKGLNVDTLNTLRRKLREDGIEYQVVKNTLLIRASEDTELAAMHPYFKGPTAVAVGYDDPVVMSKILTAFAKEQKNLELKAGFLKSGKAGKILNVDDIKALSSLPSREILLSQLLSAMNGVPTGLVRALSDIPRRFLNVLQAVKEQKESA